MSQSSALREQPSMDEILASIRKIIDAGEIQSKPPLAETPEAVETAPPSPANDLGDKRPSAPQSILPQQPLTRRAPEPTDAEAQPVDEATSDIAAAVSDYLAKENKAKENKARESAAKTAEPVQPEPASARIEPDESGPGAADPLAATERATELDLSIDMSETPDISETEAALLEEFSGIDRDLLADRRAKYDARFSEDDVGTFQKVGNLLRETVDQSFAAGPAAGLGQSTSLVSDAVSRSVSQSLASLSELAPRQQAPDLDAMAEEMLRPMLQEWLDNNLPSLVERLVRAEIERIARGEPRSA